MNAVSHSSTEASSTAARSVIEIPPSESGVIVAEAPSTRKILVMFEPRVDLNRVDFETDEAAGILRITLDYTIRRTNRRTNMVYPFYFHEGTDLTGL